MKRSYQQQIDLPTEELTEQVLKTVTESESTNMLIDNYRKMKRQMADAEEIFQEEAAEN